MQRYVGEVHPVLRIHGNVDVEETEILIQREFLERACKAMEAKSGSTVKSEVKECIDILNQMEEIPYGSELYLFSLNLFARQDKHLYFL